MSINYGWKWNKIKEIVTAAAIDGLIKYYNLEGRNFVNNYTRKYKK